MSCMTNKQLTKARQSVEIEYETEIALAMAKKQQGLEALDITAKLLFRQVANAQAYGALHAAVRNAIDRLNKPFTKHDIVAEIGFSSVENSIASCFLRLIEKNEIKVIESSRGAIPSKYVRINKLPQP